MGWLCVTDSLFGLKVDLIFCATFQTPIFYLGPGKTDNGIVVVTAHLPDGRKSLPLDIELYQHASSLPEGKQNSEFAKKPELALRLIDRNIDRKYQPGIVIIDARGNNTSFLLELELRQLKYSGGVAKNRKVTVTQKDNIQETIRLDELAQSLPEKALSEIQIDLAQPKTVWGVTKQIEISQLVGKPTIAIVMNAATFSLATVLDYFITNVSSSIVTPKWVFDTYKDTNWLEVFARKALMVARAKRISSSS